MNDLSNHDGQLPERRPGGDSPNRGAQVRETFRRVRQQYLAPFEALEALEKADEPKRKHMHLRPRFLAPEVFRPSHPTTESDRVWQLAQMDEAMLNQPAEPEVLAVRSELERAVLGEPSPQMNRVLGGLMLSSFPNARAYSPETYLEALIGALDRTGFGPAAVARTCFQVIDGCKFPPTVNEVLEQANEVQGSAKSMIRCIDRYREILAWAAGVRLWLAEVPLLASDRSNYDRPPQPPEPLRIGVAGRQSWV